MPAMFEVIVTSRSDFSEVPIARYRTEEEAQEKAQQIAVRYYEKILRAWVRVIREAGATN
jgi:hypothetical protein